MERRCPGRAVGAYFLGELLVFLHAGCHALVRFFDACFLGALRPRAGVDLRTFLGGILYECRGRFFNAYIPLTALTEVRNFTDASLLGVALYGFPAGRFVLFVGAHPFCGLLSLAGPEQENSFSAALSLGHVGLLWGVDDSGLL